MGNGNQLSAQALDSFIQLIHIFWPFLLVILFLRLGVPLLKKRIGHMVFDWKNIRMIDMGRAAGELSSMDWRQFEHLCRLLFQNQGYKVGVTAPTNDGGIDLSGSRDGTKIVAQCKRYAKRAVGRPALQQFYGTFEDHKADHGFFLTTSYFTREAVEYAARKPITLIDKRELLMWIARYGKSVGSGE